MSLITTSSSTNNARILWQEARSYSQVFKPTCLLILEISIALPHGKICDSGIKCTLKKDTMDARTNITNVSEMVFFYFTLFFF